MKEKKGGFLPWPWNVVVYVLLFAALRIFAIPIILVLMWVRQKNSPHGVKEGYCLSRTRKRLTWLIWALLVLVIAAALGAVFYMGLCQDRTYWETMDYVTLAGSGGGAVLLALLGLWLGYTAIRDAFFPAKSSLARSIRSQLPYPDEAPPVEELFAMVDNDLKENAQWFGPVGIGREWVLGDGANKIDRIRGIFIINEIHLHHTKTGTRTSRNMQLVLIDDRWQRTGTSFNNLKDLEAAADCLALRVPDAARGDGGRCSSFWTMDESERENFEREFHQKQNRRASERAQRESVSGSSQNMILRAGGEVTSRVTEALVLEHLSRCLDGEEEGFTLTPTRPVEADGRTLQALSVSAREKKAVLTLELASKPGEENLGFTRGFGYQESVAVLEGWLRREAPDLKDWDLRRVYGSGPRKTPAHQPQRSQAKLSLLYASGAAENHSTFTEEDIQTAAEGIVDGTYQLVDLTHSVGYMWIRVTAGDKTDARCTVEASKPGGAELEFYIARMPPREAAAWLTGYPYGQYLPGGRDWKKIKKSN